MPPSQQQRPARQAPQHGASPSKHCRQKSRRQPMQQPAHMVVKSKQRHGSRLQQIGSRLQQIGTGLTFGLSVQWKRPSVKVADTGVTSVSKLATSSCGSSLVRKDGTGRLMKKALRERAQATVGGWGSSRMSNVISNSLLARLELSTFVKSMANLARMLETSIGVSFHFAVRSGKRKLGLSSTSLTPLLRVILTPRVASSTKLGSVAGPSPAAEVIHFSGSRMSSRLIAELPITFFIWNESSSMKSSGSTTSLPLTLSTYPVLIGPFLSIAMPPPISALPPRASSFFLSASAACLLRLCLTTLPFLTISRACFSSLSYFMTNLTSALKALSVGSVGRRRTFVVSCCTRS
mmetsp:Transcript_22674/g.66678  ORF Transcript_22674/g.66678 Transcript_22674/m.66678 type:complete len:349 (-) Transcript_22674:191-1237(-)